jgi:hypothetical protein
VCVFDGVGPRQLGFVFVERLEHGRRQQVGVRRAPRVAVDAGDLRDV